MAELHAVELLFLLIEPFQKRKNLTSLVGFYSSFKENQETFELFYQVDGHLLSWREMDASVVDKISDQLLPQASEVAQAVNENYEEANVPVIDYAMLQFETATMAWFGRKLTTASREASLSFEELVAGWRAVIEEEILTHPIDSDTAFPYFEVQ